MLLRRLIPRTVLACAVSLVASTAVGVTGASAVVTPVPCITALEQFECATVTVPQSRSGAVPGTARVQMIKLPAQEGPRLGTLLVLAGGPGQSSTLILSMVAEMFRGANRYDIVAIDQRGTGFSEPLTCLSLERAKRWDGADATTDKPITTCANDLGAARATYTTQEGVADIDAVRSELGIDTLTLFGVSYGTKIAMAYAATHPTRVNGMLLDSVLPVNAPDAFDTVSTAAMRRSFDQICANRRCRSFLPNPVGSTAKLVKRLAASPVRDTVVLPGLAPGDSPETVKVKITPTALYESFFAADFNQFIYAQLPGAVASSRRGDDAMLIRLQAAAGLGAQLRNAEQRHLAKRAGTRPRATDFSNSMYFATTCEDLVPPWPRGTALGARQPAIDGAADAIADAEYLPFDRTTVKNNSSATYCRGWPESPTQPILPSALPDVPALVLNGSLDVRTPTSWARSAVAGMPRAQVVEIPNVGHSTTGTDLSECALSLARRFLIYRTTSGKCRDTTPPVPVEDPAPLTVGSVKPLRGKCKGAGSSARCRALRKSVTAGYLAVRDALDQWVLGGMPTGVGLRAGTFTVWGAMFEELLDEEFGFRGRETDATAGGQVDSVRLSFFSHVSGVAVDGRLRFPRYPRAGGTMTMYDERGRSWRLSLNGILGYDQRDDQLRITARSGKKVVQLSPRASSGKAKRSRIVRPRQLRRSFGFGLTRP